MAGALRAHYADLVQIGPYTVLEEIARGGMGVVYRAQDAEGRLVALKLLLAKRSQEQHARKRFEKEVSALSRLRHPQIVPILGTGEHEGSPWLALEYVEGESLQARLARGPLPIDEAVRVARQLAQALGYMHRCGVLHRDLKPDNVLLRGDEALLTDFGLVLDEAGGTRLTAAGQFLGTPGYWAPEQARGETEDFGPQTDVYGLGAVLYACLTGRPPVEANSLREFLETERFASKPSPRSLRPVVPDWLNDLCMRCMLMLPERRPATPDEVARALAVGATAAASTTPDPRGGGPSWLLAVGALALAGFGLALVWSVWPSQGGAPAVDPPSPSSARAPLDPLAEGRDWKQVWALSDGEPLRPEHAAQWPGPRVVDPFAAPRVSFAGEVVEQGGGVLQVRYAAQTLPLLPRYVDLYRGRVGERSPEWSVEGGRATCAVVYAAGDVAIPIGDAHWRVATLDLELGVELDESRNPAQLLAGFAPCSKDMGPVVVADPGGLRVKHGEAFLDLEPGRIELRLTPAEDRALHVGGEALPVTLEAGRTAGRFALLILGGRWTFRGPAVVEGRPTRVDRPGLARLPRETQGEARLRAEVVAEPAAASGPFLGARAAEGDWVRLELRGDELWLTWGRRLLARAALPAADGPLELCLWARGAQLRGVARRGSHTATVEGVWAAGDRSLRWECGSAGPRVELTRLALEQAGVPLEEPRIRHAEQVAAVHELLRLDGGVDPEDRPARAREVHARLLELARELEGGLQLDTLLRALYCGAEAGEAQLVAELAARLVDEHGEQAVREALAALEDDRVTGVDLLRRLRRLAPPYAGEAARRAEAGTAVHQILAGATPAELLASTRLENLVTDLRAGRRPEAGELVAALDAAPHAPTVTRIEALLGLGRAAQALEECDGEWNNGSSDEKSWRYSWYGARLRMQILLQLRRYPEALESALFALGMRPRRPIELSLIQERGPVPQLATQLRSTHPGTSAVALLAVGRLLEAPREEQLRVLEPLLALEPEDPRQRDLLAYVRASLELPGEPAEAERPSSILARAAARDALARERLREVWSEVSDDLVWSLVQLDPELRAFMKR